jgi:DNA polymerase-3 subunit delta
MYRSHIDKLLQSGKKIPRSLMLFGEAFLVDRYSKALQNFYRADEVTTLYSFEYEFEKARSVLSQGSLFGGSSLLIIKGEDKIKALQLKEFIRLVDENRDNHFLYLYFGDNFRDSQKLFGESFVRFFPLNFGELKNMIFSEVRERGFEIEPRGVDQLIYLKNGDASQIFGELDKLENFGKERIDIGDIISAVAPSGEMAVDHLVSLFFKTGDWRKTLNLMEKYEIDKIAFVTYSIKFIEDIYRFRSAKELRQPSDSLSVLGRKLPPDIERERQDLSNLFSLQKIAFFLERLMRTELRLKQGRYGDIDATVGELLFELVRG